VCPSITAQLKRAVEIARDARVGNDFTVLTIGFDTANDTPERMQAYARERRIDQPGWYFLSGDAVTIKGLARELGFTYSPSPRGFDHITQVTVLDPELRVYQHIYGDVFEAPALVEPLRRLAAGMAAANTGLDGLVERVRLFCTVYDPATGTYRFDYSLVMVFVTGFICLLAIAVLIVRAWREAGSKNVTT
jgi:protein SCO1/2